MTGMGHHECAIWKRAFASVTEGSSCDSRFRVPIAVNDGGSVGETDGKAEEGPECPAWNSHLLGPALLPAFLQSLGSAPVPELQDRRCVCIWVLGDFFFLYRDQTLPLCLGGRQWHS